MLPHFGAVWGQWIESCTASCSGNSPIVNRRSDDEAMGFSHCCSLSESDEVLVVLLHMQLALHSNGLLEVTQISGEVSAVPTIENSGKTVNARPKFTE